MEAGPFVAIGLLVLGILAGEHAGAQPALALLIIGGAALLGSLLVAGTTRVLVASLALAAIGFACTTRALDGQQHSSLSPAIARHEAVTVDGVLVGDPSGSTYSVHALVRARNRILDAAASGDDAMRLRILEAGDHVTLAGRLVEVRGRARWQHAAARLEGARVLALHSPTGLTALADRLRADVIAGTRSLAPTPRALVAGFLLGDTRSIPPDVTAEYRASGLSHLLAVSGENVAFVLALVAPLLRRMRLFARTTTALAVILVFAAMTRFEPSVLRASVMAAIALFGTFLGRPASRARILAYAVILLLVVDPFLLHSVAFLLSCGASAGIVFASPPIARRLPGPRLLREPLSVSFGAQLGVMPVLLVAFGSFPLVTPVTNLFAAPAAEAIGIYGFVASIAARILPAVGPLAQQPTGILVGWVTAVARTGAAVPLALDARGACAVVAIGAAVASLACARADRLRRALSDVAPR